jgi:hypothetical protein
MLNNLNLRVVACGLAVAMTALAGALLAADDAMPKMPQPGKRLGKLQLFSAFDKAIYGKIGTMKDPDAEAFAKRRYDELARDLKFPAEKPPATLDALLAYCGYRGLKSADIERLDSDVLMDFDRLSKNVSNGAEFRAAFRTAFEADDILATRFFSPKTTDVSRIEKPLRYSWRKLVRLRIRPASDAKKAGVEALYVLGNIYEADLRKNPFSTASKNNQVILSTPNGKRPMYFLVFGPVDKGGLRQDFSETSWDAVDPQLPSVATSDGRPAQPFKRYFVPDGCIQCHGEQEVRGKLNFLDSDHYQDRVEADNDFPEVGVSAWSPIFDASPPAKAKVAFDVIRKLNREIAAQNATVDARFGQARSIQSRASDNWLRLHETSDLHLPVIQRGMPDPTTGARWDPRNPTDQKLLPLLNRYCYRCHNAFKYDVFDKTAVLQNAAEMADRISATDSYKYRMPQDRVLTEEQKSEVVELLNKLDQ